MRRGWEWTRLLRRHWPILALILLVPGLLAVQKPFLGPLLVGIYAVFGGLTWAMWRAWGWRAGKAFVWRRRKDDAVLARLASRRGARDLPPARVLLMFLGPAAFGFLVANAAAGLLTSWGGREMTFETLALLVLVAMGSTLFLSAFFVPVAWIVRASGVRRVRTDTGRNDPLRPAFLVDHLTAASGLTALAVLAAGVKPDETLSPVVDMALNTLTVAALALPGTLLATLLYVWHDLDGDVARLEARLGVVTVRSFFDLRAGPDAPGEGAASASASAVGEGGSPEGDAADEPAHAA